MTLPTVTNRRRAAAAPASPCPAVMSQCPTSSSSSSSAPSSSSSSSSPRCRARAMLTYGAAAATLLLLLGSALLNSGPGYSYGVGGGGGGGGGFDGGDVRKRNLLAARMPESVPYEAGGDLVGGGGSKKRGRGRGGDEGAGGTVLRVFQALPGYDEGDEDKDGGGGGGEGGGRRPSRESAADHRRTAALILAPGSSADGVRIERVAQTPDQRRSFLEENGSKCYQPKKDGGAAAGGGKKKSSSSSKSPNVVLAMYDALGKPGGRNQPHLATELWKYCALTVHGGAYLDAGADAALLATFRDAFLSSTATGGGEDKVRNTAILGDPLVSFTRDTVHGSLLILDRPDSPVARGMVEVLVETPTDALGVDPTLLPRALHGLVKQDALGVKSKLQKSWFGKNKKGGGEKAANEVDYELRPGRRGSWTLLGQRCHVEHLSELTVGNSAAMGDEGGAPVPVAGVAHSCPKQSGYCCDVTDPTADSVVMVTRHPLLPYQILPPEKELPLPYRWNKRGGDKKGEGGGKVGRAAIANAPFVATVREEVMARPSPPKSRGSGKDSALSPTPNFFEILLSNDCLPSDRFCGLCLKNKKGAKCGDCLDVCPCYCKALCHTPIEEKFVSKRLAVTAPKYRKDPSRLVPRIVHQTWFEDVTRERYPNMSRLIESWKRSGWEYRFYSDDDAAEYLSLHFPPEVREAYDSILPGAFKADLFRYCALLIDGGVYSDMDVLLETNLDAAVPADIGFMTPVDEPGKSVGHRMCLWNGLIAAAPGHPFLAQVIETVVNNIRNRFTSVDVDNSLCPNPELSIAHSFDILFTAGPCILGASINNFLGRHPQTSFEAGTVDPWADDKERAAAKAKDGGKKGEHVVSPDDRRLGIPGRTVILKQDKWDMGAHRFTWEEENLVVAATDMPDYDDRDKVEGPTGGNNKHYSDTHVKFGIYGLEKLYTDRKIANEDIRISVEVPTEVVQAQSTKAGAASVL